MTLVSFMPRVFVAQRLEQESDCKWKEEDDNISFIVLEGFFQVRGSAPVCRPRKKTAFGVHFSALLLFSLLGIIRLPSGLRGVVFLLLFP